jgi:PhnB protein
MKSITPYLIFEGKCRKAMEFYKKCFGGTLHIVPYSQMPGGCSDYPQCKDWVMHARLTGGKVVLMAPDTRPDAPVARGGNFSLSIDCESVQEAEKLFEALGEKGKVRMYLQKTFFAQRFAMLTDQFEVQWMINLDKPGKNS